MPRSGIVILSCIFPPPPPPIIPFWGMLFFFPFLSSSSATFSVWYLRDMGPVIFHNIYGCFFYGQPDMAGQQNRNGEHIFIFSLLFFFISFSGVSPIVWQHAFGVGARGRQGCCRLQNSRLFAVVFFVFDTTFLFLVLEVGLFFYSATLLLTFPGGIKVGFGVYREAFFWDVSMG